MRKYFMLFSLCALLFAFGVGGTSVTVNAEEAEHQHSYDPSPVSSTAIYCSDTKYTCSCGDYYYECSETTSRTDHAFDSGREIAAPTCTVEGTLKYTCTTCAYTKISSIAALGHVYETTTESEPTCTNAGILRYSCIACGHSYKTTTPKLEHFYRTEEIKASGEFCRDIKYTCSVCGDYYYKSTGTTEPSEHDWDAGNCEPTGFTINGGIIYSATFFCLTCNASRTEEFSSRRQPEELEEVQERVALKGVADYYIENIYKPYTRFMWAFLGVFAAIWSVPVGISYISARKNDEKEKAKRMLVNLFIGIVVIAFILVAVPSLVNLFFLAVR